MSSTVESVMFTTADGAELHLEGAGSPRILMLHGLGYASWEAQALREALGDSFGLWSLDNRGTGRSSLGVAAISIPQLASDAADAIENLGSPVVVVGHSMGGYVALTLAQQHPELVAGLVLIGTSCGGPAAEPVPESTTRAWEAASGLKPADYARATMPLSFRPGWTDEHPTRFEALLEARLAHPTSQAVWRMQYAAAQAFLEEGLSSGLPSVPVLVVHGRDDRVVPPSNGRLLARLLPGSEFHEVADAGHLIHLEQPALVAGLIERFTLHHPE